MNDGETATDAKRHIQLSPTAALTVYPSALNHPSILRALMRPLAQPSSLCVCVRGNKRAACAQVCEPPRVPVASLYCLPPASTAGGDVWAARWSASLWVCVSAYVSHWLPPPQQPGPPGLMTHHHPTPPPLPLLSSSRHLLYSPPIFCSSIPPSSSPRPPLNSSSSHPPFIQASFLLWSYFLRFFPLLFSSFSLSSFYLFLKDNVRFLQPGPFSPIFLYQSD